MADNHLNYGNPESKIMDPMERIHETAKKLQKVEQGKIKEYGELYSQSQYKPTTNIDADRKLVELSRKKDPLSVLQFNVERLKGGTDDRALISANTKLEGYQNNQDKPGGMNALTYFEKQTVKNQGQSSGIDYGDVARILRASSEGDSRGKGMTDKQKFEQIKQIFPDARQSFSDGRKYLHIGGKKYPAFSTSGEGYPTWSFPKRRTLDGDKTGGFGIGEVNIVAGDTARRSNTSYARTIEGKDFPNNCPQLKSSFL